MVNNTLYIFAGSWNPLHQHHLDITNHLEQKYNTSVIFELCKEPFDKESLTEEEIEKRVKQFTILNRDCIITNNTSFVQRAKYNYNYTKEYNLRGVLQNKVFIVGFDTILRVDNPKYYFGSETEKTRCIKIMSKNSRFLVFNRGDSDKNKLSQDILQICDFEDFKTNDISSSKIRNKIKFSGLAEDKGDLCNIENIPYNTYFIYMNSLHKLVDRHNYFPYVTAYNGEEFIRFSWGTKVYRTNNHGCAWPEII